MKIPSLLYGRAALVKQRCKMLMKPIVETRKFELLDPGPLIDTSEVPGWLLVRPEFIATGQEHVQCYALSVAVNDLAPKSIPEREAVLHAWMVWSLEESWRILGVMEQQTTTGILDRNRSLLRPYVEAAARFWPVLAREGNRFGPFINEPGDAWTVWYNLKFALRIWAFPRRS